MNPAHQLHQKQELPRQVWRPEVEIRPLKPRCPTYTCYDEAPNTWMLRLRAFWYLRIWSAQQFFQLIQSIQRLTRAEGIGVDGGKRSFGGAGQGLRCIFSVGGHE